MLGVGNASGFADACLEASGHTTRGLGVVTALGASAASADAVATAGAGPLTDVVFGVPAVASWPVPPSCRSAFFRGLFFGAACSSARSASARAFSASAPPRLVRLRLGPFRLRPVRFVPAGFGLFGFGTFGFGSTVFGAAFVRPFVRRASASSWATWLLRGEFFCACSAAGAVRFRRRWRSGSGSVSAGGGGSVRVPFPGNAEAVAVQVRVSAPAVRPGAAVRRAAAVRRRPLRPAGLPPRESAAGFLRCSRHSGLRRPPRGVRRTVSPWWSAVVCLPGTRSSGRFRPVSGCRGGSFRGRSRSRSADSWAPWRASAQAGGPGEDEERGAFRGRPRFACRGSFGPRRRGGDVSGRAEELLPTPTRPVLPVARSGRPGRGFRLLGPPAGVRVRATPGIRACSVTRFRCRCSTGLLRTPAAEGSVELASWALATPAGSSTSHMRAARTHAQSHALERLFLEELAFILINTAST